MILTLMGTHPIRVMASWSILTLLSQPYLPNLTYSVNPSFIPLPCPFSFVILHLPLPIIIFPLSSPRILIFIDAIFGSSPPFRHIRITKLSLQPNTKTTLVSADFRLTC